MTPPPAGGGGGGRVPAPQGVSGPVHRTSAPRSPSGGAATALAEAPETALAHYHNFDTVVALIESNRDIKLLIEVKTCVRIVSYAPGRITFQPTDRAPRDLAPRLAQSLKNWTGVRWTVTLANEGGGETIEEVENAKTRELEDAARQHPMMQAVLAAFSQAKITEIRSRAELDAEAELQALPEVEDEWDPFEED
jgi:DNA polymerase-3 subunit gamma/tau